LRSNAPTHGPKAKPNNLIDFGGRILPTSHIYSIWWGNPNAFPTDLKLGATDFLGGLNTSRYLQVVNQYLRGGRVSTAFGRSFTDMSAPPATDPEVDTIGNEVARVLTANKMAPDPNGIYMVYTSNYPGPRVSYCAWHSAMTINGVTVAIAYMPNLTNIRPCSVDSVNAYSIGTQAVMNVSAHEVVEAITDVVPFEAWVDSHGAEVADKCAWQFDGGVPVGSVRWRLQKNWSNDNGRCVQTGPRPPRS